jgi:hypothetical protein
MHLLLFGSWVGLMMFWWIRRPGHAAAAVVVTLPPRGVESSGG